MENRQLRPSLAAEPPDLSDRQYRLWREMLENRTGVQIAADRDEFVRRLIARRMGELGATDADTYFREVLETVAGTHEWGLLLDRLLVKETRFFRHRPSYDYVRDYTEELFARDRNRSPLGFWSVGCSTGEETYSLAITAFEICRELKLRPNFGVIGTDISRAALDHAGKGIFSSTHLGGIRPEELARYFDRIDKRWVKVRNLLKQKVCFIFDNMLEDGLAPFADAMDVIFCQNVLVYFKRWRRRDVINNLVSRLRPGGTLVIGPGEISDWMPPSMKRSPYPGVQAYVREQ